MRMFKRVLSMLLVITMVLSVNVTVSAASTDESDVNYLYALELEKLGVFIGSDSGFELDRAPSRLEGLIMLIRLLGVETEAKAHTGSYPFTDVPSWANGYVAYAYNEGLTSGISDTLLGSNDAMTGLQYFTFMARSLGYDDSQGDFVWNESIEFLNNKGLITHYETRDYTDNFLRSDVAKLSYDLLLTDVKDSEQTLCAKLMDEHRIDVEMISYQMNEGLFNQPDYQPGAGMGYLYFPKSMILDDQIIVYPFVTGLQENSMFPASDVFLNFPTDGQTGFTFEGKLIEGEMGEWNHVKATWGDHSSSTEFKVESNITFYGDVLFEEKHGESVMLHTDLGDGTKLVIYNIYNMD